MALAETEVFGTVTPGFVTDASGILSTSAVSDSTDRGFLVDSDGRLVITETADSTVLGTVVPGFLTDANGALVVTQDDTDAVYGTVVPGFWTSPEGALVVEDSPSEVAWIDGFLRNPDGYLGVNYSYATLLRSFGNLGLLLPLDSTTGLTDLSGNSRDAAVSGTVDVGGVSGPLAGDSGASEFTDAGTVVPEYPTRRNLHVAPYTQSGSKCVDGASGVTSAVVSGTGSGGNNYLTRATCTSAGTKGVYDNNGRKKAAVEGETFTISAEYLDLPNGSEARLGLGFYTAAYALISFDWQTQTAGTGRFWHTATAPATTAYVGVALYATNLEVDDTFDVDGVMCEKSSEDGSFIPSLTDIASGEAAWSGTAHDSISAIGAYAQNSVRTYMGWAWRDTTANEDNLFGATAAAPFFRLFPGNQNWQITPDNFEFDTVATWPGVTQWVHWALVVDQTANTAIPYIDGTAGSVDTMTYDFLTDCGDLVIGGRNTSSGRFDGRMAWFSVHTSALTAEQIAAAASLGAA
ncbi:hypothetical protein KDA23_01415 [Candidatus Saccharibacteria bacterium]|nr:hypothetical protein [Candidatus Saccharibacteria bacterium]